MTDTAIELVAGIILLLFSTRTFLRQAETLSGALKLSPLIIGMTIVAIGTSLPELSVSTIASAKGDVSLAVGNIVGSNITNMLLVFASAILIGDLRIGTTKTPRNAALLLFVTILFTVFYNFRVVPGYLLGLFFLISSIILTLTEYRWAITGRKNEDAIRFKEKSSEKFSSGKFIMLFLSILGVILGGYLIVISTEEISLLTGISTGALGLTLTAVATSLPEILTTVFSQESHDEKMTMGNILGSNLYNLLIIGGLVEMFSSEAQATGINWIILIGVTVLFVFVIYFYKGKIIPKKLGLLFLLMFAAFILFETKSIY